MFAGSRAAQGSVGIRLKVAQGGLRRCAGGWRPTRPPRPRQPHTPACWISRPLVTVVSAKSTTITYRDHLAQLWLLDPVPGWSSSRSPMRRLQQAPKHQLADPALALRLLSLSAQSLATPTGAAMAGPLFELLVTLGVRIAAQAAEARVGHLRTRNGDREVDLVVEGAGGQVLGIEVKLAAAVGDEMCGTCCGCVTRSRARWWICLW